MTRLSRAAIPAAVLVVVAACSPAPDGETVTAEDRAMASTGSAPDASPDRGAAQDTSRSNAGTPARSADAMTATMPGGRIVVYQVFTRLFGNKTSANVPWGTVAENGVGKFADIDAAALRGIRELGVTHVWYTGVPHHAVVRDYTDYGITPDDPDVVKGRAGSPYAVKDYYNVDPDLALDPARRLDEFRALVERTHAHGMKVVIDIVPNHVARHYRSTNRPPGVEDFGANDDASVVYRRDNNFYYVPGEPFRVPAWPDGYLPLGGEPHPLADGQFDENPAKWTGNGARAAQPAFDDWYETVKVNYGVRPDGSHDFDALPPGYDQRGFADHQAFWQGRDVPDSWEKFRDIVAFWIEFGVDGFRYDMAEMVPVAFWSYLNAGIKTRNPDAFLLAEIYNPAAYRDYIRLGKMDYLYDKVGLYDTLRGVVEGRGSTDAIAPVHASVLDIEAHMLHFLENHDEQRIASGAFAGEGDAGFGDPTRTTIFDYWGVPAHQRWMNGGRFDGGALTEGERRLRNDYRRLLVVAGGHPAMTGDYRDIHAANRAAGTDYDDKLFAFVRWRGDSRVIVAVNFSPDRRYETDLVLPPDVVLAMGLADGRYATNDRLGSAASALLAVDGGAGRVPVALAPLASVVLDIAASEVSR